MTYHISSVVRSNVFNLRCLGKLRQYLNEKLQMQLLCRLCCQGGTTANLFVGHTKEPATESKASPGHCCKNCHSNKEVRAYHFFLLELHWLPVEMRIDYKILSLVYSYMNDTVPQYLRELIPRYLPVRYLQSSTQSRLRILSVDRGNNKTPWSQSIFQCCAQTVEQPTHYSERVLFVGNC